MACVSKTTGADNPINWALSMTRPSHCPTLFPPPASAKGAYAQAVFMELRKLLDSMLRIIKHTLQVSWAHTGMAGHVTSMPGTSLCLGHTRAIAL